ncbi:MAG: exodeoxyribonuclease III [Aestuariivita sp.]|nr:exodeoxyribonuclease III [Aestuariivita sp.]
MSLKIATWNINSIRLRENLICKLMSEYAPDIICLQECKSTVEKIPTERFRALGYSSWVARGQKSYNGVAILSKLRIKDAGDLNFAGLDQARHVACKLENGVTIHNFYVPAGGDIPDRDRNSKFDQKLTYLTDMKDWFKRNTPQKCILVGDLNIAPQEDDVWSHNSLLNVVSHTPIEVRHLKDTQASGNWCDITRKHISTGKLYSWWSYRARDWNASDRGRRLDHVWATPDIAIKSHSSFVLREARGWDNPSDHAPVFANFEL